MNIHNWGHAIYYNISSHCVLNTFNLYVTCFTSHTSQGQRGNKGNDDDLNRSGYFVFLGTDLSFQKRFILILVSHNENHASEAISSYSAKLFHPTLRGGENKATLLQH